MKRHINYFIYFGHVFYNTSVAILFFMISVPYIAKTKETLGYQYRPVFIFDMGGVISQTNKNIAAQNLGLQLILKRIFWHFQEVSGTCIEKLFYETLNKSFAHIDQESMPPACDQNGNLLPIIMRIWLAGKMSSDEIKQIVLNDIDLHNEWFSNDTEQKIIKNLVNFIFTPELFIKTQYIPDDAIQSIKQLKIAGYKLYLLSNWDRDSFLLFKKQHADLFVLFDGCVVSGLEGVIKPDNTIYRILLERYNISAEQCIFIDDQEENINAAQREHIKTILCKNPSSMFHILRNHFLA